MGNSDSEPELKRKKEKKQKDKDSGDERKEKKDKEKEEKKPKTDKGKEERKEKKDKEKEHGDKDKGKEERKEKKDKGKEEKGKEEKKEKKDKGKEEKGKEEKKEKKDKGKDEKDKEKDEKKEKKDKGKDEKDKEKKKPKDDKDHDDKKDKQSHPSGSEFHAPSGPHSGEVPWFLREPDTAPVHQQPSQTNPNFPSVYPPSQQQPFRAVGEAGGLPSTENVPPSGHRVPLSPNDHFPTPDRLGQPPATESGGSIPVYIGSAIFPDSVHPCRIVPSLNPPCRVLYGGGEVEHHGRYDLLPITQDMEWVPTKLGELPPGRRPVEGGYETNGNKLYHALGPVKGTYAAGKAGQHLRGAIIPFEGNEHHVQENYSVLCWR